VAGTKQGLIERIRRDQAEWRQLVADVGHHRMHEPGPMGEWSFRDLVSHLNGWRSRTVNRVESAVRGVPPPPDPWPANLEDDDKINDWIRDRDAGRSAEDLLTEYDLSFDRLASALESMPEERLRDPTAFDWVGGPLVDAEFGGHLRDEHMPSVRAWLTQHA